MAGNISELFGYSPDDKSEEASRTRESSFCPFLKTSCTKHDERQLH